MFLEDWLWLIFEHATVNFHTVNRNIQLLTTKEAKVTISFVFHQFEIAWYLLRIVYCVNEN